MNQLYRRDVACAPVSTPSPQGTSTSPSICPSLGAVLPQPLVECLPSGRLLAQQSAQNFSFISPIATSHSSISPVVFCGLVKQQLADLVTMSAKQTPFPNMQPVTGASGGAILSPCERMPTKLVSLDPCHSSILLPMSFRQRSLSACLSTSKISSTSRWQAVWVLPWVFSTYFSSRSQTYPLGRGFSLVSSLAQFESSSLVWSDPSLISFVNTWMSSMVCSISSLALTLASVSKMKLDMCWNPKLCGISEQKSLLNASITSLLSPLALILSMMSLRISQPFFMLLLASFPSGIFFASYPISFIWLFIMFMSNISFTNSCTQEGSSEGGWSFLSDLSGFSSSSSASQFISTTRQPFLVFSCIFLWYSLTAVGKLEKDCSLFCPTTPTRPHRVNRYTWLGLLYETSTWMMQNLLLLPDMLDWLRVAEQQPKLSVWILQLAAPFEKYWSTGAKPFSSTFFISPSPFYSPSGYF